MKPEERIRTTHEALIQRGLLSPDAMPLDESALAGLQWAWRPAGERGVIVLAFADEVPGSRFPKYLAGDGVAPLTVRAVRAPRVKPQLAINNLTCATEQGTLTAIVCGRNNPNRHYALSAGHVLAGTVDATLGDNVDIAGAPAKLSNWLPIFGNDQPTATVDAALAEISSDTKRKLLKQDSTLAPQRFGHIYLPNQVFWLWGQHTETPAQFSGVLDYVWVDAPYMPGRHDYLLMGGLTYRCDKTTKPGDSGAALKNSAGDLLGLHCAGAPDSGVEWNGVGVAINKVFEELGCQLIQGTGSMAPPAAASRPRAAPPKVAPRVGEGPQRTDIDTLARTLWGEARGETDTELSMCAVAHVVLNRVAKNNGSYWWGGSIQEVCRRKWQFSCWNVNDPNLPQILSVTAADARFSIALAVARRAVAGQLGYDNTLGATHYFADSIAPPSWAYGKRHCAYIGHHRFFNDIE